MNNLSTLESPPPDLLDRFVGDGCLPIERSREKSFAQLSHRSIPIWKRVFDVTVSAFLLVLLSPFLIAIGVFIRCVSQGPVFFRQSRLGEMGNEFEILKFRTFRPSNTATAEHQKFVSQLSTSNQILKKPNLASQLIPGGKLLRSLSIDELPQLINILRGEMSLIGPRPDVLAWHQYSDWQLRRFETRPGITGLWQVSGKNRLTFHQMINLDIEYVERRCVLLDGWILLMTLRVLFFRDNG